MRIIFIFIILVFPICILAQNKPVWVDDAMREYNYPNSKYLKGYACCEKGGDGLEEIFVRLKNAARAELISSISLNFDSKTEQDTKSLQTFSSEGFNETTEELFYSEIKMSTAINDLPGLVVEIWNDEHSDYIHAFAHISKNDLIKKLQRRVNSQIAQIEVRLGDCISFIDKGEKLHAREIVSNILPMFASIENDYYVLFSLDGQIDKESLLIEEYNKNRSLADSLYHDLKTNLSIYIDKKISETFPKSLILNKTQNYISEIGGVFVDNGDLADCIVKVEISNIKNSETNIAGNTLYLSYVYVDIKIEKGNNGKIIYSNTLSVKGVDSLNSEKAILNAYDKADKELEKIVRMNIN